MTMPYFVINTINGGGFESQVKPFDEPVDISKHQNGSNGRTLSKSILPPKERLLSLSGAGRRSVRIVRICPGCDAVTIGNLAGTTRNAALASTIPIAGSDGVLKSDRDDESRGARKPIHFWLADDIPAELVVCHFRRDRK